MSRTALITGVSRRAGIGFAVARRLLDEGYAIAVQSWAPHDAQQPWGSDDLDAVLAALGTPPHISADLAEHDAPGRVMAHALRALGRVDVLVANHARSAAGTLDAVTAAELDAAWAVNARATVLLVQAFAAQAPPPDDGRVVLFTSGQHLGPMADELPYAISKGAVHQMTRSLADAVAERGIAVNAINPGPVDTGWATPALVESLSGRFPSGRWSRPEDVAGVVAWLAAPGAVQLTGQVLDAEGGFRR